MRRYFWAKIPTDFFSQPIPKKLKRLPNGTELQLLYLQLILLALPENGKIEFLHLEDSVEEEIALSLDAGVEDVTVLLSVLERAGVWEANADGCFLAVVPALVGSETPDAARKREQRARTTSDNVQTMSDTVQVVEKRKADKRKQEESISKKSQEEIFSNLSPSGTVPTPRAFEGAGGGGTITIDDLADADELYSDDDERPF
jgi:predicted phage replisome organizer